MFCNNVNYVKNNAIFEPPNVRACSRTPPKLNQDFVKEHNRTPLKMYMFELLKKNVSIFFDLSFRFLLRKMSFRLILHHPCHPANTNNFCCTA